MAAIPEKERGGERLLNARCSECTNLNTGNFCSALKRTVPGTRHLRKCDLFQQGDPNPLPVRSGKPQKPNLVQCVSCEYFSGWGLCDAGVGELGGELGSRIWRWCDDFLAAEPAGSCSDCRYLVKQVCTRSGFPVTRPDKPTSCRKYLSFCNISVL
jgi:hypothetical protein